MVRKNIIILFLIAFTTPVAVWAQKSTFKPEWNVGVGFGPVFSSVDFQTTSGNTQVSTSNVTNFHGGIAVRYVAEKRLGFIVELNYIQEGWKQDFKALENAIYDGFEHSHQLSYFEMPILTHIYFGNKVRFFFNLGPKIGYLISESEKINAPLADFLVSGSAPANFSTYQYYRNADRKIDYGLMGGLGLEFRTGIGSFALEGRYYFGLADIYKNTRSDFFDRSANRTISAKLTYYVKLF